MTSFRTLAFAGLTVVASAGAASAQDIPVRASRFYALYQVQSPLYDIYLYDHSGSRGRLDLGASPLHPEGPGNFSD
jgi:hypothetical protein